MRIRFKNRQEVRMGSPYKRCRLEIDGQWQPKLDKTDWQDVVAESADGRYLGLVRWDTRSNVPGFHLIVLDTQAQRVYRGRRINGCCAGLKWSGRGFTWQSSSRRRGHFAFFAGG